MTPCRVPLDQLEVPEKSLQPDDGGYQHRQDGSTSTNGDKRSYPGSEHRKTSRGYGEDEGPVLGLVGAEVCVERLQNGESTGDEDYRYVSGEYDVSKHILVADLPGYHNAEGD